MSSLRESYKDYDTKDWKSIVKRVQRKTSSSKIKRSIRQLSKNVPQRRNSLIFNSPKTPSETSSLSHLSSDERQIRTVSEAYVEKIADIQGKISPEIGKLKIEYNSPHISPKQLIRENIIKTKRSNSRSRQFRKFFGNQLQEKKKKRKKSLFSGVQLPSFLQNQKTEERKSREHEKSVRFQINEKSPKAKSNYVAGKSVRFRVNNKTPERDYAAESRRKSLAAPQQRKRKASVTDFFRNYFFPERCSSFKETRSKSLPTACTESKKKFIGEEIIKNTLQRQQSFFSLSPFRKMTTPSKITYTQDGVRLTSNSKKNRKSITTPKTVLRFKTGSWDNNMMDDRGEGFGDKMIRGFTEDGEERKNKKKRKCSCWSLVNLLLVSTFLIVIITSSIFFFGGMLFNFYSNPNYEVERAKLSLFSVQFENQFNEILNNQLNFEKIYFNYPNLNLSNYTESNKVIKDQILLQINEKKQLNNFDYNFIYFYPTGEYIIVSNNLAVKEFYNLIIEKKENLSKVYIINGHPIFVSIFHYFKNETYSLSYFNLTKFVLDYSNYLQFIVYDNSYDLYESSFVDFSFNVSSNGFYKLISYPNTVVRNVGKALLRKNITDMNEIIKFSGSRNYFVLKKKFKEIDVNLCVILPYGKINVSFIKNFGIFSLCVCLFVGIIGFIGVNIFSVAFKTILGYLEEISLESHEVNKKKKSLVYSCLGLFKFNEIRTAEKSLKKIKIGFKNYEKFLPKLILEHLMRWEVKNELEYSQISVLFCDIAGFSRHTEILKPEKLVLYLTIFFTITEKFISENGGIVDKYIGDCVMALWGDCNHAKLAVSAAIGIVGEISDLEHNFGDIPDLECRIGVESGMGLIGPKKISFTALGDVVNTASRLEQKNKSYRTNILIGSGTHSKVSDLFICRWCGKFKLRGKERVISQYEVLTEREHEEDRYIIGSTTQSDYEKYLECEWVSLCVKKLLFEKKRKEAIFMLKKYMKDNQNEKINKIPFKNILKTMKSKNKQKEKNYRKCSTSTDPSEIKITIEDGENKKLE